VVTLLGARRFCGENISFVLGIVQVMAMLLVSSLLCGVIDRLKLNV
jgi:hypothetical protein